jgi:hypothetical protein
MSKYAELSRLVDDVITENRTFRDECERFASEIIGRLTKYYGVPSDQFSIVPIDHEEESSCSLREALTSDDKLNWHFGIKIVWNKNVLPVIAILLRINFKKDKKEKDNYFTVSLDNSDPNTSFIIHDKIAIEYETFFDFIYEQIRNTYENHRLRFYRPDKPRQIGF